MHEAYLRLAGGEESRWDSRGHFFAAAAEAMRRILVENARRKRSLKAGGGMARVDLDQAALVIDPGARSYGAIERHFPNPTGARKARAPANVPLF